MSQASTFRMMSLYNQRANNQLLAACIPLSDAQLHQHTGSFFSSIIQYWNHILFGDLILLGRLSSNDLVGLNEHDLTAFPTPVTPLDVYHSELCELTQLRQKVDKLIINYCQKLTDDACQSTITYTSTEGEIITKNVADITQHLFNHQTHHRGQLTCLLSQFGIDYGCMDLPVMVPEGSN